MRRKVFISRSVGPSAVAGARERAGDRILDGDEVIPVDDLAAHPVASGALREILDRALRPPVGGERELVVLADEDDRQQPRRREVHRLVRRTLAGGAVAEERDHGLAGAADFAVSAAPVACGRPAPTIPLQPRICSSRSAMCIEPPSPLQ